MSLSAGTRLGPYEIAAPLGAGGMGEVYRARDPRLGREVAIKVLPADLASDSARLKRFEKEARSASALNHPNIVTIYEIGSADSVSYIAMELVEGKTLRELLFAGPLPTKKILGLAAQIADGLARAHEAGIVHRDLKPENVMVTKDGRVKILDFGLAKLAPALANAEGTNTPTETGTGAGVILGTVGYMSPEQANGQPVDFRSDQFSFGSILYELITGKRAFQKKTGVETLSAIIQSEPEPIGTLNADAPAPFRWIVERCLAKEPDDRYIATRDLARDILTLRDRLSEARSGEALIAAAARPRATLWKTLGAAALIGLAVLAGKWIWKAPPPSQPSFQRLTFRSGFVNAARFSPDGRTIVYSARWDGEPPHIFLTRPEAPESQKLDLPDANLVSISSSGEVAVVMGKIHIDNGWFYATGTLATAPLAGGAPREIAEDVRWADWSPDGKRMLVVRSANAPLASGGQLEFPVGKVIHRGEPFLSRFSPAGDRIAYLENFRLHVTDLSGHEFEAVSQAVSRWRLRSLAWSPSGDEIWFVAGELRGSTLRAVSLAGRERVLLRMPHDLTVEDVSKDGRMLLGLHHRRREVWAASGGEASERNLTIFGDSNAMGFSADGKMILDNERGSFYLRRTDGSLPKKLGEGFASELSADGKWAAVIRPGPPAQVVLVPTGAGEERLLERGAIEEYTSYVRWSQDGRKLLFFATEKGLKGRLYLQEVAGGLPRPVTPDGMGAETASISPDGRFVIVQVGNDFWMYSTDGGERRPVAGFLPTDYIWKNWSEDGRFAYAWNIYELPFRVSRVELATGRREPWKTIMPQDPVGIWNADLMLTPDGKSYVYNCSRDLSDLYLVEGLK